MASYVLDSSALVKRYVVEQGSVWVSNLVNPASGNDVFIANIAGVEVVAALARRGTVYGSRIIPFKPLIAQFRNDFEHLYEVVEVSSSIIASAMQIAELHSLRGYDSVQLATALSLNRKYLEMGMNCMFVSADLELNSAAIAEGLTVENPNDHP